MPRPRGPFGAERRCFSQAVSASKRPGSRSYLLKDSPNNRGRCGASRPRSGKEKQDPDAYQGRSVHIVIKHLDRPRGQPVFPRDLYNIDTFRETSNCSAALERFQNQNRQLRPGAEASGSVRNNGSPTAFRLSGTVAPGPTVPLSLQFPFIPPRRHSLSLPEAVLHQNMILEAYPGTGKIPVLPALTNGNLVTY